MVRLNEPLLKGNREGQMGVDIKGSGRDAGRVIFKKYNDESIDSIEILTDHKY